MDSGCPTPLINYDHEDKDRKMDQAQNPSNGAGQRGADVVSPESGSGDSHHCVRDRGRFAFMMANISTAVCFSGKGWPAVWALPGAVSSLDFKGIPKEP